MEAPASSNTLTGSRADLIIADDIQDAAPRDIAVSPAQAEQLNDFINSLSRKQAWDLILRSALMKKCMTPQFRGVPPRGQGRREWARAQGYGSYTNFVRLTAVKEPAPKAEEQAT